MTRKISTFVALLVAATLMVAAPAVAPALTLTDVSVLWDNPIGPGAGIAGNVVNRVGVGTGLATDPAPRDVTEVRWGTASPPSTLVTDKSGLGFDPFFPPPAAVPIGVNFQLGTLFHFNNPILLGTELSSVDLTLTATFLGATPATDTFKFRMLINETPNFPTSGGCAEGGVPPCQDAIRFTSLDVTPHTFLVAGDPVPFTLFLVGFGAGGSQTTFFSPENSTNNTPLFARIDRPTTVPNPSALLLIGLGLVGLAGISRIRSRQN